MDLSWQSNWSLKKTWRLWGGGGRVFAAPAGVAKTHPRPGRPEIAAGLYSAERTRGFGDHPCWYLLLGGLFLWQGWMTYGLFGNWGNLSDERPLVSGSHPLHLYFGWLGTSSFFETGRFSCFDPAFQAGFPKTPVFDSGSRPAELLLVLSGQSYNPAAYKCGLAIGCLVVPGLLWLGARASGLGRLASGAVVAGGLVIWWGPPGRSALEAGDWDLLFGSISALAYLGLLIGFHRDPGLGSTLGLLVAGSLGWFFHPLLLILLFPVLLVYYLSVGSRHSLGWHGVLLACQAGALALNRFWLWDWLTSLWLRLPVHLDELVLTHRTLITFWNSSLWGDRLDRVLAVAILGLAVVGVSGLNFCRERATARVFGFGAGGLFLLAGLGMALPQLGRLGTAQLFLPGLWFAVIPAVFSFVQISSWVSRWTGSSTASCAFIGSGLMALGVGGHLMDSAFPKRWFEPVPFTIGLSPEQKTILETLQKCTTNQGRILWEERSDSRESSRWTALLPMMTERVFMGGLGPDVPIEHAYAGLVDQTLAGRPIPDWTDFELEQYCKGYNIGWVVGRSPATIARLRGWNGAKAMASFHDGTTGILFSLQPHSYILKGRAQWVHADWKRIILADVVPEDGKVVLSLHYQAGMQVSPARVQIEREPDPDDPIPFVRLKVPDPVARITITFNH